MLDESGYDCRLKFAPQEKQATRENKARKRKITWYNPSWDSNVKTNVGRKFLLVIDKCFPKNHPLNTIFNRHTLKLSYSCMPNKKAVISSHNKNMLAQDHGATAAPLQQPRTCITVKIDRSAHSKEIAWKKTWRTKQQLSRKPQRKNYVGLASNFKERYRNHQTSFRQPSKRNETELSKYIWDLKDRKKSFRVKWRILRSCQPYSNESKKCNLCLQEKYFIIFRKDLSSRIKRNELASSCRHRNRLTLKFFRIT